MNGLSDRRSFLKWLGMGVGVSLLPPMFNLVEAATHADQKLLVVIANGGIRSIDFCDAYPQTDGVLDISYDFSQAVPMSTDGDWRLPLHCEALAAHADKMAIIRNINMESASHNVGPIIGMNGIPRTNVPAGSVIIGEEMFKAMSSSQNNQISSPIKSIGFPSGANAGELDGPVFGEPSDLVDLFDSPLLSTNIDRHKAIRKALVEDNNRFATGVQKASLFHDWKKISSFGDKIRDAGLSTYLDPAAGKDDFVAAASPFEPTTDAYALRFAAGANALIENIAPVVTVSMDGFDTHASSQVKLCGELSSYLSVMMDKLNDANIMSKTTILVVSDFDRTPQYNSDGGTDHGVLGTVALFGNGIKAGAHGEKGEYPGQPGVSYRRRDIWATILKIFGVTVSDYFNDAEAIEELIKE